MGQTRRDAVVRFTRAGSAAAWCVALGLLLASCGGGHSPQSAAPPSAMQPDAAILPSATRSWVNGNYVETGTDSVPAQVYRLYRAAFAREADASGLGYQVAAIEIDSHSLQDVAANFVASPEFAKTYGNLDDGAYVTLLYANVLHRTPDAGGLQYWKTQLASGSSRAQVLLGFSESTENKTQTATSVAAGLVFPPAQATRVYTTDGTYVETNASGTAAQAYRLYQAALGRAADTGGLGYQVYAMERLGQSLSQVAQNLVSSNEFAQKYGALDNTQFVTQLYANVLHRAPDAGGLQYWTGLLAGGTPRSQVVIGLAESAENKANTASAVAAGIHFAPYPSAPALPAVDPLAAVPPLGLNGVVAALGVGNDGIGGDASGDGGVAGRAGTGTPLAYVKTALIDAKNNMVFGTTDANGNFVLKFNTGTFTAPFVVKTIDASGNVLASVVTDAVASGKYAYANVNPLTDKIVSDALDASVAGTDKAFTAAAVGTSQLAQAKQNLSLSITSALLAAGVSDTGSFDAIRAPYAQDGSGVGAVLDSLAHTRDPVSGRTVLHAKLAPLQTDASGVVTLTPVSATAPLAASLVASADPGAFTLAKLTRWVNAWNACLAQSSADAALDAVCRNRKNNVLSSATFKENSSTFDQYFRWIYSQADSTHIQGTTIRNAVVLYTSKAISDPNVSLALVEITVSQPFIGSGSSYAHAAPVEYTKTLTFQRDDSLPASMAGNWIPVGNQRSYDLSVRTRYVKAVEVDPLRAGNTVTGIADMFQSRLSMSFNVSSYNASGVYGDSNVRAARVTGPGLPAAGVVLVRSSAIGASWLAIHNKTGTIPSVGTLVGSTSSSFGLAAVASNGAALVGTSAWSPTATITAASAPDFSQLGAYALYRIEIFLNTNTSGLTPDAIEYARNVAPVSPPSAAIGLPAHDLSASRPLVTASLASTSSVLVQWANNAAAGPVFFAQLFAQERSPKGATSGYTTNSWDLNSTIFVPAPNLAAPTQQAITSSLAAFPSLTTLPGDYRQVAVWSYHGRAYFQNELRWDN